MSILEHLNTSITLGIELEPGQIHTDYQQKVIYNHDTLLIKAEYTGAHTVFQKEKLKGNFPICDSNIELVFGVYKYDTLEEFLNSGDIGIDAIIEEIYEEFGVFKRYILERPDINLFLYEAINYEKEPSFRLLNILDDKIGDLLPIQKNPHKDFYINCDKNPLITQEIYDLIRLGDKDTIDMISKFKPIKFIYEPLDKSKLETFTGIPQITIGINYAFLVPIFEKYAENIDIFESVLFVFNKYTKQVPLWVSKNIESKDKMMVSIDYEVFKGFIILIIYTCILHNIYHVIPAKDKKYFKAHFHIKPRTELHSSYQQLILKYPYVFDLLDISYELFIYNLDLNPKNLEILKQILELKEERNNRYYSISMFKNNLYGDFTQIYKDYQNKKIPQSIYSDILYKRSLIDIVYQLYLIKNPDISVYVETSDYDTLNTGFYDISGQEVNIKGNNVFADVYAIDEKLINATFVETANIFALSSTITYEINKDTGEIITIKGEKSSDIFEFISKDENVIIELRSPHNFIGKREKIVNVLNLGNDLIKPFLVQLRKIIIKYSNSFKSLKSLKFKPVTRKRSPVTRKRSPVTRKRSPVTRKRSPVIRKSRRTSRK